MQKQSTAMCEQILTIDKARLIRRIGCVESWQAREAIQRAVAIQLAPIDDSQWSRYKRELKSKNL